MINYNISVGGEQYSLKEDILTLDMIQTDNNQFHILQNGQSYHVKLENADFAKRSLVLNINGHHYNVNIEDELDQLIKKMGLSTACGRNISNVKAPMPGLVLDILVEPDQIITKGESLLILEAMKMENVLTAEGDGKIKSIKIGKGKAVDKGQVIIEMY